MGGGLGGADVEWEELVDGDVLRSLDAFETLEGEGSFAIEKIRDMGLRTCSSFKW